jgi:hypothetical protein
VERLRTKAHIKLLKQQSGSTTSLPRNPFEMKWYYNITYLLCRPAGYDWIEASAFKTEDARTLNPGVLHEYRRGRAMELDIGSDDRLHAPPRRGEQYREKDSEPFDSMGRHHSRDASLHDGTMVISLERPRDGRHESNIILRNSSETSSDAGDGDLTTEAEHSPRLFEEKRRG